MALFVRRQFPRRVDGRHRPTRARLYAILTGRVSEIRGIARLNEDNGQYEYLGQGMQRARQREIGLLAAGFLAHAART